MTTDDDPALLAPLPPGTKVDLGLYWPQVVAEAAAAFALDRLFDELFDEEGK